MRSGTPHILPRRRTGLRGFLWRRKHMLEKAPQFTERLLLRDWQAADKQHLRRLNADPKVMRYFPHPLTSVESDAFWDRMRAHHQKYGFSLWALETREGGFFIGLAGLLHVNFKAPFAPAVEIGWRLFPQFWGQGYATEAARQILEFGFDVCSLEEIVAFTAAVNLPSRRVMERLGMRHQPSEDFDHPRLPLSSPLCRHVLYRMPWSTFYYQKKRLNLKKTYTLS